MFRFSTNKFIPFILFCFDNFFYWYWFTDGMERMKQFCPSWTFNCISDFVGQAVPKAWDHSFCIYLPYDCVATPELQWTSIYPSYYMLVVRQSPGHVLTFFFLFSVDTWRTVELFLLPVLLELHHQPLLLRTLQCCFQVHVREQSWFFLIKSVISVI